MADDKKDKPEVETVRPRNIENQMKFYNWRMRGGRERFLDWPRPPGPDDTIHQKEDPDDTSAYASGGMVKHGSSTHVSCKRK